MKRSYTANGQRVELVVDPTVVAVRFREPAPMSMRATVAAETNLGPFRERHELAREKYTILPVAQMGPRSGAAVDARVEDLNARPEVARATPVFALGDRKLVATDRVLVGFTADAVDAKRTLKQRGLEIVEQRGDEYVVRLGEYEDPFDVSEELSAATNVEYAEPDFVVVGPHLPGPIGGGDNSGADDPAVTKQYALSITKADKARDLMGGIEAVRIAILDDGVDTLHEDLKDAIVAGYDAIDDDEYQEPNDADPHGTACAGLAAAVAGNGLGGHGIGAGCELLAVRIAHGGPNNTWVTNTSWIVRAIDWAWRHGASILSNSWGGGAPSTAIAKAFERARTQGRGGKGSVIVIAVGNHSGAVGFPANLANVVAVAASNEYDEPKTTTSRDGESWWGTCFGPEVSIAAPGVHNFTTDISGERGYNRTPGEAGNYVHNFNGTSSATPIVAGAAALILSANLDLSEADVRAILCETAERKIPGLKFDNGHNDYFGYGRLDVLAAVREALGRQKTSASLPSMASLKENGARQEATA